MSRHEEQPRYRDIDQGYAWVILCVSFMSLVISCGALYSVSIFNVIFLEVFGESKALTSWIGSILIGLYALVGPLSSLLTAKLGWRASVILGGLLATAGTLTSSLATNIIHMFISFGFLTGLGHGLVYTPAIVVVGYYFDRRRTMASGIASVGAGIGMMVFPPLVTFLRKTYSWREIMVFISAVNLHICVLGAMMRPLPLVPSGEDDENDGGFRTPSSASRQSSRCTVYDLELQYLQIRKSPRAPRYMIEDGEASSDEDQDPPESAVGSGYLSQNLSVGSDNMFSEPSASSAVKPELGSNKTDINAHSATSNKVNDNASLNLSHDVENWWESSQSKVGQSGSDSVVASKMSMDSPQNLQSNELERIFQSKLNCKSDFGSLLRSKSPDSHIKGDRVKPTAVRFKKQSDGICNSSLCIFCVSIFTAGIGLSIVYLHLSAFAMEHGASEHESSMLISILGVSSIASRIFTGLAGNDHSIDNVILYVGTFGVAGMCTLFCPLIGGSYVGRILFAASFGFYGSCFNVLLAPLTVELVGIDGLNMAFGVEMAVCGTAYLLGPPLAGQLYDMTEDYSVSFYLSGCCLIMSAVIMLLVATTTKTRIKRDMRSLDRIAQA